MSKRLQVMMPDDEYRAVQRAAHQRDRSVSELVRDSLRRTLADEALDDPEHRIAAILRFARFNGPTGEIGNVLSEIERGRALP
jgi:hypothetical protein